MRNHKTTITAAAAALVLAVVFLAWQSPGTSASAQVTPTTFEIIHFAETRGRITNAQNAFDTTIYAHYVGSTKMTVELYLYNERTGLPIPGRCAQSGCRFIFAPGSAARQAIHFEDLVDFSAGNVVLGTAYLVVRDDDPSKLLTDIYLVNSRTNAFDLSYVMLPLHRLPAGWRSS
jgi:hypothetical protein